MLELVIEAMVDAVVVIDADGKITLANAGAEILSGYTRDELRALRIVQLLSDEASGLRTVVRRRVEEGSVLRREESWLFAKSGERVPVSVTASPILDASGALHGIVVVARDIRELRQLLADKVKEIERRTRAESELIAAKASIESQLEETRTQLLAAERLATLGTLAGGVGHELRNIAQIQVAAVDELTAALREKDDMPPLVRRLLPDLERVGDHVTLHGERLMQLARPGPDRVAPIDLNEIVRDVAAMLKLAGKLVRVQLVLSLHDKPLTCSVNRTRIEQILVNLITNAVDASAGSGMVTVLVSPSPDRTRAVCQVHDTGPGIPPTHLDKIWEPFFTTKGDAGTGLGLPVVRDIVTSYGGTISVETGDGRGTTFTFDLPR
jgi:PAS domain S-box-containing protein